jgi:hypothetical protein
MKLTCSNKDYTATHVGLKMKFYHSGELQCELEVRTASQARKLLEDWSRLKKSPVEVQQYQELIKRFVGATVDDVTVSPEGEYYINGKAIDLI